MAYSNPQSVITINLRVLVLRWLILISIAAAAITASVFSVRWYMADVIAEYAPDVEAGGLDMTRLALRWAPSDPYIHRRMATLEEEDFSATNLASAVREWELAVGLSPYDYRYWMELGRAYDAAGDPASSQKALQRAVALAPAYSHPRWYLGNALLREGKLDEAFAQFKVAADNDDEMRPQVFSLAWSAFDKDIETITRLVTPTPTGKLQLANYLVSIGAFDEAIKIWSALDPKEQKSQHDLAEQLEQSLIEKKQFRGALVVMHGIAPDPDKQPLPEKIWNGGFEDDRLSPSAKLFGWSINSRPQIEIEVVKLGHTGDRSLRMQFKAPNRRDPIQASQMVVVEPATAYRLECFARTQDINSAGTVVITVTDAVDNSTLATSSPLPNGNTDWQRITVDFKTKPKNEAIVIGFARADCGGAELCPIFGNVWYDDFRLERLGSREASAK